MFSASDSWLGFGIVVIIGGVVVGLAACIGKLIIRLFGTGQETGEISGGDKAAMKSRVHETA